MNALAPESTGQPASARKTLAVRHPMPPHPLKQLYAIWECGAREAQEDMTAVQKGEQERTWAVERITRRTAAIRAEHERQLSTRTAAYVKQLTVEEQRRWDRVCSEWMAACELGEETAVNVSKRNQTPMGAVISLQRVCAAAAAWTEVAYLQESPEPAAFLGSLSSALSFVAVAREWRTVACGAADAFAIFRGGDYCLGDVLAPVVGLLRRAEDAHAQAQQFHNTRHEPEAPGFEAEKACAEAWRAVAMTARDALQDIATSGALQPVIAQADTIAAIAACDAWFPLTPAA